MAESCGLWLRFVAEGAYVFITGRRQTALDAAVQQIGASVTGIQSDVAKLADLDRLYAALGRQQGRLDVLCANAGGGESAPLGALTEAHCDTTFNTNVKGTSSSHFGVARSAGVAYQHLNSASRAPLSSEEAALTPPFTFDALLGTLHQQIAPLPGHRRGTNTP